MNVYYAFLIISMARVAMGLTCYFCKSDYNSRTKEEAETEDIPYCGDEPYEGKEGHEVVCDIYYDNLDMIYPTFKMALSSTKKAPTEPEREHRKRRSSHAEGIHNQNGTDDESSTDESKYNERMSTESKTNQILKKRVFPYNISSEPWGTQRIEHRVKPYYCLTIRTINSTFPNRVCGLRYFLDCQLLIELTTEPLEQSSFVTSCHQCNTNLCNESPHCNYHFIFLFLYSSLIHVVRILLIT